MGSLSSKAGIIIDKPSFKLEGDRKIGFQDSNTHSLWQKLKWDVGLGLTNTKATGLSLSTSVFYPLNDFISIQASTGLVAVRGPSFGYRTEKYYNDGTGYGYEIKDYLLGDYTGLQSSLGVKITEPLLHIFSLSVAPYHLRLLRSTSIIYSDEIVRNSSYSSSGSDGESSDLVSVGGYNYGFIGIEQNDFGVQLGLGFNYRRWGFMMYKNVGIIDWGDNERFGSGRETLTFYNFQLAYLLKK
jgi:hypothetical protein